MKKEKLQILNAFLLGVIAGFLLTPLRNGVNVHVESNFDKNGNKSSSEEDNNNN